jgi:hypothetical protein
VIEVAAQNANPLISISYHHDGDMNFLLGVADPTRMAAHLTAPAKHPGGRGGAPRAPNLTIELETFVRALRDAEVLVLGLVPAARVINRHDVY